MDVLWLELNLGAIIGFNHLTKGAKVKWAHFANVLVPDLARTCELILRIILLIQY